MGIECRRVPVEVPGTQEGLPRWQLLWQPAQREHRHHRAAATETTLTCALFEPRPSTSHLLSLSCTERAADIQRQNKRKPKTEGILCTKSFPDLEKTATLITLTAVLQLKPSVSLPEAHSLPLLAPSFAGNIRTPGMPAPLASRSHRASLLVLTLPENASGRTSEGQSPTTFPPSVCSVLCLRPSLPLSVFPSPVCPKDHRDLLSLSGDRGLNTETQPHPPPPTGTLM